MAMNRRTFYLTFIYGLWALIGTILAIPAAIYLLVATPSAKGTRMG